MDSTEFYQEYSYEIRLSRLPTENVDIIINSTTVASNCVIINPQTGYHELKNHISVKSFDGSFLIQDKNNKMVKRKELKCVTKLKPSRKELAEIEFAFNICKYAKSNPIVLSNNFSTIGIGGWQPSRVDSCKIAIQKARKFQPTKISNAIAASDAFFPFSDGLDLLIKAGVKIVVQPGGYIRDKEIINHANKTKIKMLFTGVRHFYH